MSLARDLLRAIDPGALMAEAGTPPDEWQSAVMRSPAKRKALLCCRQSGKSTVAAARALSVSMFEPKSLVLLLSPSLRQSSELFRKCIDTYRRLDGVPDPASESQLRLELPNESRIISLPGSDSTIRGYSAPRLIVIDEAAHCSDSFINALLPMMAANPESELLALSTPNGMRGWFHQTWAHDKSFEKTRITWRDCPRITQEFVEMYRAVSGELMARQEFECEFLDADTEIVFPTHLIDSLFTNEVQVASWL